MTPATPNTPFARAAIRDRRVTLNRYDRRNLLSSIGPASVALAAVVEGGVALADLSIDRREDGNELIVDFVTPAPAPDAEEAILDWARAAGYARVWLPERVVALDGAAAPLGRASVECPTCAATWSETSPDFIAGVRRAGWFPPACPACGGSLPEWELDPDPERWPETLVTSEGGQVPGAGGA